MAGSTIRTQRQDIADLLADNASLKDKLPTLFLAHYPRARADALEETELPQRPEVSPVSMEQALEAPLDPASLLA